MTEPLQTATLFESASNLKPLERSILLSLRDKGPGLPFEVAVRVLKLPEEISGALLDLKSKSLIRSDRFSGTVLGDELIAISSTGEQVLAAFGRLEQQAAIANKPRSMDATSTKAADQQKAETEEADLLRKLGDVAIAKGEFESAATYYKEALGVVRQLRNKLQP